MMDSSTRTRRAVRTSRVNEKNLLAAVSCRSVELQQTISSAVGSSQTLRQFETATVRALKGYPGVVASIWNFVDGDGCRLGELRLQGPAFEREDVQQWLSQACVAATQDATKTIAACPLISNLLAVIVPTSRPDGDFDVLAILVTSHGQEQLLSTMHAGQLISRGLMLWHTSQDAARRAEDLRSTAAVVDLCARMVGQSDAVNACIAAVNELQEHLGCETVFAGLLRGRQQHVELTAVSSLARIDPHSTTSRLMAAALNECAVRSECAVWPAESAESQHQLLAHQQLARHQSAGSVCSIPLIDDRERIVGVLSFCFAGADRARRTLPFLEALANPLGAALAVMKRTRRSGIVRMWRRLFADNPVSRLTALVGLLAAVVGSMFVPVPYRIPCRFAVEAVERQYCAAPYDGLLSSAFVQPGDVVTTGQILARMDDRELLWQLSATEAESQRARKERDVFLVDREVARSYMSALESSKLKSEAELLKYRLNSLEIRSPMEGIVLAGSVDRRVNVPVQTGDMLFEIAPVDRLRFDVAIPVEEAAHVEIDQTVLMRIDGQADRVLEGRILHIRPRSEIVDSQNVFVAEVELDNLEHMSLRPGMQGAARVVTPKRPLGWNLFHRAWEYIVKNVVW